MKGTAEEKRMLIESMKKLVSHVSNNPQRQIEIFEALSLQDLMKIITNFSDENEYLRRISALLLCELLYLNPQTKASAIRMLSIEPSYGRICLSGIPQSLAKHPVLIKKCVEVMRGAIRAEEEDKLCWFINIEGKGMQLQFLDYKKYSSITFLDPVKNLFGVTVRKKREEICQQKSRRVVGQRERSAQSRRGRNGVLSPLKNSQYHKSPNEARNKSKDSYRTSIVNSEISVSRKDSKDNKQIYNRPITSQLNMSPYNCKKEDLNNTIDVHKRNTIQNISQFARNSYIGAKVASHKPSESSYKPHQSYHPNSDSKYQSNSNNLRQKYVQPERKIEGRQSLRPATQILKDHEMYYTRVKEVLRR